jgi:hypothetical protein
MKFADKGSCRIPYQIPLKAIQKFLADRSSSYVIIFGSLWRGHKYEIA